MFEKGRTCLPDVSMKASAAAVPGILQAWLSTLQQLPEVQEGMTAIAQLLSACPGANAVDAASLVSRGAPYSILKSTWQFLAQSCPSLLHQACLLPGLQIGWQHLQSCSGLLEDFMKMKT